jgi:two-component system response regulator
MTRSILLVDDSADDVELTKRALRSSDVREPIHVANDGREAIEQLFGTGVARPALPSLVLLDLKLPGINGVDVLRRIRADPRTRTLPVVILTSSNERIDLQTCYELGANSYVRKPVSFSDFLAAARQIATYWLSLNEPPPVSI